MSPALNDGDVILVRVTTEEVKRNEIVLMVHPQKGYSMVARVIGLPNETILLKEGRVYINDEELFEPHIEATNNRKRIKEGSYRAGNGQYFVLGDNRDNSEDSRYFGMVNADKILGRYYYTISKSE